MFKYLRVLNKCVYICPIKCHTIINKDGQLIRITFKKCY
jgi:ferredoxin-like protein FixX